MINPLSTISMTAIEIVSAAKTSVRAFLSDSPARRGGIALKLYPNKNAKPTDKMILGSAGQKSAEEMTMPIISPMAHPVRQCSVARSAVVFADVFMTSFYIPPWGMSIGEQYLFFYSRGNTLNLKRCLAYE